MSHVFYHRGLPNWLQASMRVPAAIRGSNGFVCEGADAAPPRRPELNPRGHGHGVFSPKRQTPGNPVLQPNTLLNAILERVCSHPLYISRNLALCSVLGCNSGFPGFAVVEIAAPWPCPSSAVLDGLQWPSAARAWRRLAAFRGPGRPWAALSGPG